MKESWVYFIDVDYSINESLSMWRGCEEDGHYLTHEHDDGTLQNQSISTVQHLHEPRNTHDNVIKAIIKTY